MGNVLIDARAMLPPEPLERAIAALDLLKCKDELTLILNRQPHVLLHVLRTCGYKWSAEKEPTGGWRYRICKKYAAG